MKELILNMQIFITLVVYYLSFITYHHMTVIVYFITYILKYKQENSLFITSSPITHHTSVRLC